MNDIDIIQELIYDEFNEKKKLKKLEKILLKKKEKTYNDSREQYEKEIEQAKLDGNIEQVEKKYEPIEQKLYDNYFYFWYIIYLNLECKTLKDIIKSRKKYNEELKNDELYNIFENDDDNMKILYNETSFYKLLRKINRKYRDKVIDNIKIRKEYEKLKAQKKIEKLSIIFDKKNKQKIAKNKEAAIIEKYEYKIDVILKNFKNKFAKLQREDEVIKKSNDREDKILEKAKKHNKNIEKRNDRIIKKYKNRYDKEFKNIEAKKQEQYEKIKKIKDNKKEKEQFNKYIKEYDKEFNKFHAKKDRQWDKIMKLVYGTNENKPNKEDNN